MRFVKLLLRHGIYLLINALVFCLGYIYMLKAYNLSQTVPKDAVFLSIGTSLIASGIVALLDLGKDLLKNKLLERIRTVVIDGGIESIYPKRDLDRYDNLMRGLRRNLDITGYTLNAFYESFSDLVLQKAKRDPSLSIRILLVNPESEFARHRAQLEGRVHEAFKNSVDRVRTQFRNCENIEIRQVDSPLTTMIFRIDDVMFIGPHFHKKASKSTVTMELNKHGWMFEEYEKEFQRLWNSAEPITTCSSGGS